MRDQARAASQPGFEEGGWRVRGDNRICRTPRRSIVPKVVVARRCREPVVVSNWWDCCPDQWQPIRAVVPEAGCCGIAKRRPGRPLLIAPERALAAGDTCESYY